MDLYQIHFSTKYSRPRVKSKLIVILIYVVFVERPLKCISFLDNFYDGSWVNHLPILSSVRCEYVYLYTSVTFFECIVPNWLWL